MMTRAPLLHDYAVHNMHPASIRQEVSDPPDPCSFRLAEWHTEKPVNWDEREFRWVPKECIL